VASYLTPVALVGGRLFVPVPFDPDVAWAPKPQHHIHGTVGGCKVRGVITTVDGQRGFLIGASWLRDFFPDFAPTDEPVAVEIVPEGPQRADLDPDIAAALAASPGAAAFFDSLAQFYRRAYLKWIDGTKRRPEVRAERIAQMVVLLESGLKERPKA
jgi:hypothetical protein